MNVERGCVGGVKFEGASLPGIPRKDGRDAAGLLLTSCRSDAADGPRAAMQGSGGASRHSSSCQRQPHSFPVRSSRCRCQHGDRQEQAQLQGGQAGWPQEVRPCLAPTGLARLMFRKLSSSARLAAAVPGCPAVALARGSSRGPMTVRPYAGPSTRS